MFYNHYVASGGGDLFPLVIIIVAIIAHIIKAAKGAKSTEPPPARQDSWGGDNTAPEDELRKFLASLSGNISNPENAKDIPVPPPVPKPQARPVPQPVRTSGAVTRPKATETLETPYKITLPDTAGHEEPPLVVQTEVKHPDGNVDHKRQPMHIRRGTHHFRSRITCMMSNREALREAILLREILGPCLALRRIGTGAPGL